MNERILELLLAGITAEQFVVFYVVGIAGILVRFLYNLGEGILFDNKTPYNFRMKFFVKGLIRLFVSMIVMAFVIARFYEFSHYLVDVARPPNHPGGMGDVHANITIGSAFMLGLGIDEVVKRIVGRTIKIKP